jgi:hypothetical protein
MSSPAKTPVKDAKIAPTGGTSKTPPGLTQRRMSFKTSKSFDASSFQNLIDKNASNDPEKTPLMEIIRLRVKKYIATTFIGRTYVNVLLVLSVVSCVQYIYQTYLDPENPHDQNILGVFNVFELALAALFAFDWCLNIFIADHRWEHFFRYVQNHLRIILCDNHVSVSLPWWTSLQSSPFGLYISSSRTTKSSSTMFTHSQTALTMVCGGPTPYAFYEPFVCTENSFILTTKSKDFCHRWLFPLSQ